MTEEDARTWIRERWGVPRETLLEEFVELVREASLRQNLIASSTSDRLWTRHVVDSAQLLALAGKRGGKWLDIGAGAGFPGMVIACLRDDPITLCEPRKRRAEFLATAAERLGLAHVEIVAARAERIAGDHTVISARAVASLPDLLSMAWHLSKSDTLWLLPKGRGASEEVATVRKTWHGSFHVEQSITQPDSLIVLATGVVRR